HACGEFFLCEASCFAERAGEYAEFVGTAGFVVSFVGLGGVCVVSCVFDFFFAASAGPLFDSCFALLGAFFARSTSRRSFWRCLRNVVSSTIRRPGAIQNVMRRCSSRR